MTLRAIKIASRLALVVAPGRKAPSVRRRGRGLRVNPNVRATCPADFGCTTTVIVRKRHGGAVIATASTDLAPGASSTPTASLHGAAAKALLAGASIPVRITVTIDHHDGFSKPVVCTRLGTLRL